MHNIDEKAFCGNRPDCCPMQKECIADSYKFHFFKSEQFKNNYCSEMENTRITGNTTKLELNGNDYDALYCSRL